MLWSLEFLLTASRLVYLILSLRFIDLLCFVTVVINYCKSSILETIRTKSAAYLIFVQLCTTHNYSNRVIIKGLLWISLKSKGERMQPYLNIRDFIVNSQSCFLVPTSIDNNNYLAYLTLFCHVLQYRKLFRNISRNDINICRQRYTKTWILNRTSVVPLHFEIRIENLRLPSHSR